MAYTNVETLAVALAALNSARQAFRREFCYILFAGNRVFTGSSKKGIGEINSAMTVVRRAQQTVNNALEADPALRLSKDQEDRWIIIRTVA